VKRPDQPMASPEEEDENDDARRIAVGQSEVIDQTS
jgi:hypothetical protein